MLLGQNDEKMIEHYIKEEVKKETSYDKIKKIIQECFKEIVPSDNVNAKDLYVCSYIDENNDKRIGLFKREDMIHSVRLLDYNYYYSIYKDTISNYVGIYSMSNDPNHHDGWLDIGDSFDNGKYIVNIKMEQCLGNFDKFRQIWRKENNISTPYDASVTTMVEITTVRDYIEKNISKNIHNRI